MGSQVYCPKNGSRSGERYHFGITSKSGGFATSGTPLDALWPVVDIEISQSQISDSLAVHTTPAYSSALYGILDCSALWELEQTTQSDID